MLCVVINHCAANPAAVFQKLPLRTQQPGNTGLLDYVFNRPPGSSFIQNFFELSHQRDLVASYRVPPCEGTQRRHGLDVANGAKQNAHRLVNDLLLPTIQAPHFFLRPKFPYPLTTRPKVLPTVPLTGSRLPAVAKVSTFSGSGLILPTAAKSRRFSPNHLSPSTARPTVTTTAAKGVGLTLPKPLSARRLPFFVQLPSTSSSSADKLSTSYSFNVPKKLELPISSFQKAFQPGFPRVQQKEIIASGHSQATGLKLPFSYSGPIFAADRYVSLSNVQPSRTKLTESPVQEAKPPLPNLRKNVQFTPVFPQRPSRAGVSNPQAKKKNIVVATLKKETLQRSNETGGALLWGVQPFADTYGDLVANESGHLDDSERSDIPIESEQVKKQEISLGIVDLETQLGNELKAATKKNLKNKRKLVRVFKRPVITPQSPSVQ